MRYLFIFFQVENKQKFPNKLKDFNRCSKNENRKENSQTKNLNEIETGIDRKKLQEGFKEFKTDCNHLFGVSVCFCKIAKYYK